MGIFRSNPRDVFTPRAAGVNDQMYVERPHLQERLQRAVNGSQHIALFGDSGAGKTWLYQRYLKREGIPYRVVDLSVAMEHGMDHAFRDALTDGYGWAKAGRGETRTGGAKAVLEAHKKVEEQYTFHDVSPFDKLVTELSGGSSKPKFIVFDNLEQASSDPDIISSLARLIIRLDNPRFALSGVRFLLVGVVSDMRQLIAHHDQAGTVVNRLSEIPEVENLSYQEASDLVLRGFGKLKTEIYSKTDLVNTVCHFTFRNPQQIHAICYQIACEAEKNDWLIEREQIERGFECWVEETLSQHKAIVEPRLNKKVTRVQRRNQVLFSISMSEVDDFSAQEVEQFVKHYFPPKDPQAALGCFQILSGLADGENPVLVHIPTTGHFRFAHPKIRLAIRALLCKSEDGEIQKLRDIDGLSLNLSRPGKI